MKTECARCGATHNVRWVAELQDYLCGLHKRNGPKLGYGAWCAHMGYDPGSGQSALAYTTYRRSPNNDAKES